MLRLLLDTGCVNATFWVVLLLWLRLLPLKAPARLRVAGAALLFVLVLTTMALALYRAYSVPRDILQDVVSAQEFLARRSPYPADMSSRMAAALEREGPRSSLLARWPELQRREQEQRQATLSQHWVQAHPPFATIAIAPFVGAFGVLGAQIAFFAASLSVFLISLHLLYRELQPGGSRFFELILAAGVMGWDPILTNFRAQNWSLLLACLLTISWACLRRGRPIAAGAAAGLAAALKLVPGLVAVVFLQRRSKPLFAFLATLLLLTAGTVAALGRQSHEEYYQTAHEVVDEYAAFPGNLSLLGLFTRSLIPLHVSLATAKVIWAGVSITAAVLAAALCTRPVSNEVENIVDVHFALAMTLMPLLSPVSWDHYLAFLILPLALLGSRILPDAGIQVRRVFFTLLLTLAIPEAAYQLIEQTCRINGVYFAAIWVVSPLRTYAMVVLFWWLTKLLGAPSPRLPVCAPRSMV